MKFHPGYEKKPTDPNFVKCKPTPLSEEEATYYLREAWREVVGSYPSKNSLALLWAQSLGETGRWKSLRNNNWGNIKRRKEIQKWTSYPAGEFLNGEHKMFYPYHPQTHFAAWDTPLEGAKAYIRFLSQNPNYSRAWVEVLAGDPVQYCVELKKAGYFTAPLDHYTKGIISLVKEFKSKYDQLISWKPEVPEPEPEPEPEPKEFSTNLPQNSSIEKTMKQSLWLTILNFLRKIFSSN